MRLATFLAPLASLLLAGCACCATPVSYDPPPSAATQVTEVTEVGIAELQARMTAGTLTGEALVRAYLDRIAAIDDAGPALHAVIETNPDALTEAALRDVERAEGRVRGPLHGIPVLLKDNIDATPMVNAAGSLALAGNRPADDAFLVRRLRDAGAVILGKTNLSEWANFRSTRSSSGWSARGGQVRNPYVLDRSPCGSSSGTGSAIAASLATVGVGTETNGSILCPAAVAGLVGVKPTVGLVSRDGIIPIAASQDTAGPMARSVADAAALLGAMAGPDPADPATTDAPAAPDYLAALDPGALRGARIGVLRAAMGGHPDVDAAMERAIATLRAAGAEVVDAEVATAGQWGDAQYAVLLHEFKAGLDAYLAGADAPVRSLADVIAHNEAHAAEAMPWFGQEILIAAQATHGLADPGYVAARDKARRLARTQGLEATLARDRLDALVAPTTSPAWPIDLVNGDHFSFAGYGVAAVAGTPSVTVPMGDVHGLPIGIAFLGPAWSEAKLLGYAHAFEQATRARQPPRFLPTLPLP